MADDPLLTTVPKKKKTEGDPLLTTVPKRSDNYQSLTDLAQTVHQWMAEDPEFAGFSYQQDVPNAFKIDPKEVEKLQGQLNGTGVGVKYEINEERGVPQVRFFRVGPVRRALNLLDRVKGGINAGFNALTENLQMSSTESPVRTDPTGVMNRQYPDTVGGLLQRFGDIPERLQAMFPTNPIAEGVQAFQKGEQPPFRMFSQLIQPDPLNPEAPQPGKTQTIATRLMDLTADVQTDPVAAAQGGATLGAIKAIGATAKLPQAQKAIQAIRGSKAVQKIEDKVYPLAYRWSNNAVVQRTQALIDRTLGNIGRGRDARLARELIKPYELEHNLTMHKMRDTVFQVRNETSRMMKLNRDTRDAYEAYAAEHQGASPIAELLRHIIKERIQQGKSRQPFNEPAIPKKVKDSAEIQRRSAKQKAAMIDKLKREEIKVLGGDYQISPTFLLEKSDAIIDQMNETEKLLLKTGVKQTVNKGGGYDPVINVDEWLDDMFGPPPKMKKIRIAKTGVEVPVPGSASKPRIDIRQVREAAVRNFINELPTRDTKFLKPLNPDGTANPGWESIGKGGVLGGLEGYQIPEPLKNFLDVELAAAAQRVSDEAKSTYIKRKDLYEWLFKNVVGGIKRGLIGNPATQIANLESNTLVVQLALKRNKVSNKGLEQELKQAFQDVMKYQRTAKMPPDIEEIRKHARGFDATLVNTNLETQPGNVGQVPKVRYIPGTDKAFEVPTPGKAIGKLLPHNYYTDFQGLSEQAYKLALYRKLRKAGYSAEYAAAQMDKYMFDYADRGPFLEMAERFGITPFLTYNYKAFDLLADTIVNRPDLLVNYPRLQELAFRGYGGREGALENVSPRYRSGFTFPLNEETGFDVQRFIPFGAGLEGIQALQSGEGFGSAATSALGFGRAGQTPLESALNVPLFGRLFQLGAGVSPYSEASRPSPLIAEGAPPTQLKQKTYQEAFRNLAPGLLGGRLTQELEDVKEGKTRGHFSASKARTMEDVLLQYGLGLRTFPLDSVTQRGKKLEPERRERIAAYSPVARSIMNEYRGKDGNLKDGVSLDPELVKAAQAITPEQARGQLKKAIQYLQFTLPQSGRVVVDGKVSDEGKDLIKQQIEWIYALANRVRQIQK